MRKEMLAVAGVMAFAAGVQSAVLVKSLTVGETKMPDGFYGALDCTDKRVPPENRLDCLADAGVVRSGSFGLAIIVR